MLALSAGSGLIRYASAAAAVLLVVAAGQLPLFDKMQFGMALFAVVLVSWYAGAGPGLLTAVLSALALQFFYLAPVYSFSIASSHDVLRLFIFVLASLLVTASAARLAPAPRRRPAYAVAGKDKHSAQTRAALAFEQLTALLPDQALFLLDSQGNVLSWCAQAERLTGFSAQQILHQHFRALYPASAVPNGQPLAALQAAACQRQHEEHVLLRHHNGSRYPGILLLTALDSAVAGARTESHAATKRELCGFLVSLRGCPTGAQDG
jgi:K+-sensing histidine kinase KdpD